MKDISVIITSRNEYPLNFMTVFSLIEELKPSGYDWEIIMVDNQPSERDDTRNVYDISSGGIPSDIDGRIKYVSVNDKLGHWNAKNAGMAVAEGRLFFFPDAHIVMSHNGLVDMIKWIDEFKGNIGGLHAFARFPKSRDWNFKDWSIHVNHWCGSYKTAKVRTEPEEVSIASTCCMLARREVFTELGGWNPNFKVYFGGEGYMVWKHILCGYPHYVHHTSYFWHPYLRNRPYPIPVGDKYYSKMVSAYCIGGDKWLDHAYNVSVDAISGFPDGTAEKGLNLPYVKSEVKSLCEKDRNFIASKQVMTIDQLFEANGINCQEIIDRYK